MKDKVQNAIIYNGEIFLQMPYVGNMRCFKSIDNTRCVLVNSKEEVVAQFVATINTYDIAELSIFINGKGE